MPNKGEVMLGALIAICVIIVTFVYNTKRVEHYIDREPAGLYTGFVIGFPMLLTTLACVFVCWWLDWSHQNLTYNAAAERFVLTGLLVYLGPVVVGSMLNIAKKNRQRRNDDMYG